MSQAKNHLACTKIFGPQTTWAATKQASPSARPPPALFKNIKPTLRTSSLNKVSPITPSNTHHRECNSLRSCSKVPRHPSITKRMLRCEPRAAAFLVIRIPAPGGPRCRSVSNSIPLKWPTLKQLKIQTKLLFAKPNPQAFWVPLG